MALVMGAASIAGEERDGTIGLLLGNPKGRTHVLVSKAGAMVLLAALSVLILWGVVYLIAALLDVEIGGLDVGALSLHMFCNVLFYGFLATAISAWTGNRGAAAGVTTAVLVLSFFAVGLLPLIEELKDLTKAFPWYYFDGSDPVYNGINWGHLGVLLAGAVAFGLIAVIGVNRRDLKGQSVGVTLVDRLRGNPLTRKVIGQLAGSARVSSIWLKAASEYQGLLLVTAAVMFLMMGIMMGPILQSHPRGNPDGLRGPPGSPDRSGRGWQHQHPGGLVSDRDVRLDGSHLGHGGHYCHRGRRTGRRRIAPDDGPAARQPGQALEDRAGEELDDGALRFRSGIRNLRRSRARLPAGGPRHGHRQYRRNLPAADAARSGLRRCWRWP